MKFFKILGQLTIIYLSCNFSLFAQEWQWSVPVVNSVRNKGVAQAYLWVPPKCKVIKGIILAQHNMEEISILENPIFRARMAELDLAEIWIAPDFDLFFNFKSNSGEILSVTLADLARKSGYKELNYVPYAAIGHSAAASWPYYLAAWNPQRTFAAISVSGQWPYFRGEPFAPDIWEGRNINYIPCLETMGEYENAENWSKEGLQERQKYPLMPLSMLACPDEGHFASSDKKAKYLAFYIKKAIQYRYPKHYKGDKAANLKQVDPKKTGWLMEKWTPNSAPSSKAAPVTKYKGKSEEAFWFFDRKMVRVTEKYQKNFRKKPQLLGILEYDKLLEQQNTHQQLDARFMPNDDGISFSMCPVFLDTVPGKSPRPAAWTGLAAGSLIDHPEDNSSIILEKITGPFKATGHRTFELCMERGINPLTKNYDLWFALKHPGDKIYKAAVQQLRMVVAARNTEGIEQCIDFAVIPDVKVGTKSIRLFAKSDSGLPIRYYIVSGPAQIKGDKLEITQIPVGAKLPIKVTVGAWQYGSSHEPKVKTTEEFRSFLIFR